MAELPKADAAVDKDEAVLGAPMIARARRLMIISGLTTVLALAAVITAIGYRVFRSGGSGAAAPVERVITLPKGAHIAATAVAGDRIVVTLDVAGATEIRSYDVKTLRESGRLRFVTEP